MKTTIFSFIAATTALLALASPSRAGVITLQGGPTFTPADAFTNNTIMADTTVGVGSGVVHFQGGATISAASSDTASISVSGTYGATAGEMFSLAYSFTVDLNVPGPATYTISAPSGVAVTGSFAVAAQGNLMPGLHRYQGRMMAREFPTNQNGDFTATVTLHFGSATAQPSAGTAELNIQQIDFELDTAAATLETPSRAQNLSTRGKVGRADDVLIGGFIITGTTDKQIVLRAIGPSLMPPVVTDPLLNPVLELYDSTGALIDKNDNWKQNNAANRAVLVDSNLAPTEDAESALVEMLAPGKYTAVVRGVGGGSGVALVETYDLDITAGASLLANLSTRGNVGTGDNVMIGGLIIGAGGGGFTSVIIRGLGPSLMDAGITNALADPALELHDGNGDVIDSNDNWMDDRNMQTISNHHLAPTNANEAALYEILPAGQYTAILSGAGGSTGIGLVETYDVEP
ncbi:MAG: hypothetical protein ACRD5Z_09840 [Bryobacteraceae bacterium]